MNRKLDKLGRIVIPVEIRKEMNLQPGDEVEILQTGNSFNISKYKDTFCPECLMRCEHTDNYCKNCGLDFKGLVKKRKK